MDHQNLSAPVCAQISGGRRLVAAGYVRRAPQPQPGDHKAAALVPEQDETLRQERAQALADARPSYAASLLAAIADQIGDRRISHETVTGDLWLRASAAAVRRVLDGLCEHTATHAVVVAMTSRPMPRPGETNGEYALRLRDAARGL
ncbi:hypothetical protein LUW75_10755 [Streptomyces sp. MRC013]|uniref:hypothetical protein n=1 Tax=Streptomyces sp. MRC013 TaxID=2898276 RepID=UPI002026220D|nr:hypothetical protein [Streptomyces sp. MRC013]URM90393.1 hypothetical protein LUW75_10755 [Streptomyces sp. MRC013]